ncbi:MAG: cell volume regulation protein A [Salibacteraceae bacterium]|jgi:Kef-type K+ transport system membrane component KefB
MNGISPYHLLIGISLIIILSYLFNLVSKKTSIPSVLLLIILGVIIKQVDQSFNFIQRDLMPLLEILGIVGLIMIVLEAALDLKLEREKWPILWRSFVVALLGLVATSFAIGGILDFFLDSGFERSLIYAIPLSILSSAIVLPSVNGLNEDKKEFMIYESTFSDILGITFFYLMIQQFEPESTASFWSSLGSNVGLTVAVSLIASYILILIFQKLTSNVKLFLLISVLILLYAIGKLNHLSSLLIILVFGLVLNNPTVFFRGPIKKWIDEDALGKILTDFRLITIESAFIVRTFFFVIFGTTIVLSQLVSITVFFQSLAILAITFGLRWVFLRITVGKDLFPQVFIAPRGLITVLLFFAIPVQFAIPEFENGILLYVILATSILMTWSLIRNNKEDINELQRDDFFDPNPSFEDSAIEELVNSELGIETESSEASKPNE